MSKALSIDLRVRVLAVVAAGATHREAGERFGVSAASVSRWRNRERDQGDPGPKALGGDRRSGRIEAHKTVVMAALGPERDASIEEVRQSLAGQGLVFGFGRSSVSSSATRSRAKKDRACDRAGPSGCPEATRGLVRSSTRSRPGSPRLRRRDLGLDQYGPSPRPLPTRRAAQGRGSARPLEKPRPSSGRSRCAASSPPSSSTGRSTATPSRLMSPRGSSPSFAPATSSSWTISPATRGQECAR